MRNLILSSCAAVLGLASLACGPTTMKAAPSEMPPVGPSADKATVVFSQQSLVSHGSGEIFIVDKDGKFLGQSFAGGYFSVDLPPGEYYFVAFRGNTSAVHATIAANAVYYVKVEPFPNFGRGGVNLVPVKPSDAEEWAERSELTEKTRYVPVPEKGQPEVEDEHDDMKEEIAEAIADMKEESAEDQASDTILPSDGEGPGASAPATEAPPAEPGS